MHSDILPPWYVLTGGPCSGKTTLIRELKERGYSVLPEPARAVIASELAQGKVIADILKHPLELEHKILAHHIDIESQAPKDEILFLDRGVVDNYAYYKKFGLAPDAPLISAAQSVRYRKVFLLALIDFLNDSERYETVEEAGKLQELLREAYQEQGYEVIEVPVLPITERADYILARID